MNCHVSASPQVNFAHHRLDLAANSAGALWLCCRGESAPRRANYETECEDCGGCGCRACYERGDCRGKDRWAACIRDQPDHRREWRAGAKLQRPTELRPEGLDRPFVEPCLSNQKAARETLSDNWATYSAGDKNHCVSLVSKAARQAMSSSSRASRCRYTPGGSLRSARPIKP